MTVLYGGRLGRILAVYPHVHCPICLTPQVQITQYNQGDPFWKCRHCNQVFSMPFKDPLPIEKRTDIPKEVATLMKTKSISLLRAWRLHLGLYQKDIARAMGVTPVAITNLEKKQTDQLRPSTRKKLADALKITPSQLDINHQH
ncbi:helix-turn-helix domain-containing protein [Vibrio harveyi]|uniref:helix-turn-helix domain-containing protein n=1 Tax=Vibrio harveyi TaxID=669 RepID=UPI003BB58C41